MWRTDLLLCTDCQMSGYKQSVSGQRHSKHVPIAMQQILNKATVGRNNRRAVFSMWSVLRCYRQGTKSADSKICMGVCEEMT
jgi:hypothetical protein